MGKRVMYRPTVARKKQKSRLYKKAIVSSSNPSNKGIVLAPGFSTRLTYGDVTNINPGIAGVCGVQVVSASGLYDPDITGIGHQPKGFDQISPMFQRYYVYFSQIRATFAVRNSETYDAIVGISVRRTATTSTDPRDYLEDQYVSWKMIAGGADSNVVDVYNNVSLDKFLGDEARDKDTMGTDGTNPTSQVYFHIWAAPIQSADMGAIDIAYQVKYDSKFLIPQVLPQS